MAKEFECADLLVNTLKEAPVIYIYPTGEEILFDREAGEVETTKAEPFGDKRIKPGLGELNKLYHEFVREVKVNKYKFSNFLTYLKDLHVQFHPLYEEEIKIIEGDAYNIRKGIKIFYDYHPDANPEPIDKLDFLPKDVLAYISNYCVDQKNLIIKINNLLNSYIPDISEADSLTEPIENKNDHRLFLGLEPEEINNYFSFFCDKTKYGQQIMSQTDLEYFLQKNFQGFPLPKESRNINFNVIRNVDFSHIIFSFYNQYGLLKYVNRNQWAQLLKNSFPRKFTGESKTLSKNLKANPGTIQKLTELELKHPF